MRTRQATTADTPFLRDLHHRAYHDVVLRQFGRWDLAEQGDWFDKSLREADFSVIEESGSPIGAFGTRIEADHVQLVELQVLPEWQNKGFGARVLSLQQEAALQRQLPIRLRVLLENRALALYVRHGFIVTGQTDTHYLLEWLPPDSAAAPELAPPSSALGGRAGIRRGEVD
jgi:GNAT superfamily N-acetyltransferase